MTQKLKKVIDILYDSGIIRSSSREIMKVKELVDFLKMVDQEGEIAINLISQENKIKQLEARLAELDSIFKNTINSSVEAYNRMKDKE